MQALFIGQTYIDVTFLIDRIPIGDEKAVAQTMRSASAAMRCRRRSAAPSSGSRRICYLAGRRLARAHVPRHGGEVRHLGAWPEGAANSSLSFVMPNHGQRAILRCRDDHYLHPVPPLDITGCRALHLDGHQADAAIHYAKLCRERGILTSLDGGGMRSNTLELLEFIDVAICSERLCEQLKLTPARTLALLKRQRLPHRRRHPGRAGPRLVRRAAGQRRMPALAVPPNDVIDTERRRRYLSTAPMSIRICSQSEKSWESHFRFARAASAHSVRYLGIEHSLPTRADVLAAEQAFREAA